MDVVHHHVGSPRNTMIAQKEATTRLRVRMLSADSGGGFFVEITDALAFWLNSPLKA